MDVRSTCTRVLAVSGKRNAATYRELEIKLLQAIHDPAYKEPHSIYYSRPISDYAHEALWYMVVESEDEEGEE